MGPFPVKIDWYDVRAVMVVEVTFGSFPYFVLPHSGILIAPPVMPFFERLPAGREACFHLLRIPVTKMLDWNAFFLQKGPCGAARDYPYPRQAPPYVLETYALNTPLCSTADDLV